MQNSMETKVFIQCADNRHAGHLQNTDIRQGGRETMDVRFGVSPIVDGKIEADRTQRFG